MQLQLLLVLGWEISRGKGDVAGLGIGSELRLDSLCVVVEAEDEDKGLEVKVGRSQNGWGWERKDSVKEISWWSLAWTSSCLSFMKIGSSDVMGKHPRSDS